MLATLRLYPSSSRIGSIEEYTISPGYPAFLIVDKKDVLVPSKRVGVLLCPLGLSRLYSAEQRNKNRDYFCLAHLYYALRV